MWLFIIVGGIFCLFGSFEMFNYLLNKKYFTESTIGKVVSVQFATSKNGTKNTNQLLPTYEYIVEGQTYRTQLIPELFNSNKYTVGQEDTIKYHADNPEQIIVVNGKNPYLYFSLFIIAGIVIIVLNRMGILTDSLFKN